MTGFATLTSKNQLTLPAELVAYMRIAQGTRFWVEEKGKKIYLEKVPDWEDLVGIIADNPIAKKYTVEQVIQKAKKAEAKKLMNEI